MCSPALMLDFYYVLSDDTEFVGLLIGTSILFGVYTAVFGVTLFSAQITASAHKPKRMLFRKMLQKCPTLYRVVNASNRPSNDKSIYVLRGLF